MTSYDLKNIINDDAANVMLVISAKDLRDYSEALSRSVAKRITDMVICEIKETFGDRMEYMTSKEVMHYFGLSTTTTLFNWHKTGYLRHHKIGGRNVYLREDVMELAKHRKSSKSPTTRSE